MVRGRGVEGEEKTKGGGGGGGWGKIDHGYYEL